MRLYRYRPFRPEFLRSEINEEQVFLWRMNDQNDPFEGQFSFEHNISAANIYLHFSELRTELRRSSVSNKDKSWLHGERTNQAAEAARFFASASDADLQDRAQAAYSEKQFENAQLLNEIDLKTRAMTSRSVISCFSAARDSPTMFAHYATDHSGVCIEYEVQEGIVLPVEYVGKIPSIPLLACNADKIIKARLLTKHLDWRYENEYRLVLYDHPSGLYSNSGIKVISVTAGCKMKAENRKELGRLIGFWKRRKIDLWAATPKRNEYAFHRTPLDA